MLERGKILEDLLKVDFITIGGPLSVGAGLVARIGDELIVFADTTSRIANTQVVSLAKVVLTCRRCQLCTAVSLLRVRLPLTPLCFLSFDLGSHGHDMLT